MSEGVWGPQVEVGPDREQALGPGPSTGGRKHRKLALLRECRGRETRNGRRCQRGEWGHLEYGHEVRALEYGHGARARSKGTFPRVILLERPAGEAEREGLADDGGADLEEEGEAAVAVEAAEDAVGHGGVVL